jgi:hypothetical protein
VEAEEEESEEKEAYEAHEISTSVPLRVSVLENPVTSGNFYLDLANISGVESIDIRYNATPEPATGLLALTVSPALLMRRRRRSL